jgi:hypothetical protein
MLKELKIDPKLIPAVLNGKKRATIRKGRLDIQMLQKCWFVDSSNLDNKIHIFIRDVKFIKLKDVSKSMLDKEGYETLEELFSVLASYYPDITLNTEVTYVEFSRIMSEQDVDDILIKINE